MSITYSVAGISGTPLTMAVHVEFQAGSTAQAQIYEIGVAATDATNTWNPALVRTLTVGTASTTISGQNDNPLDPTSTAVLATAWTVPPTIAATPVYLKQVRGSQAIGDNAIWIFDRRRPLIVQPNKSIAIWNISGSTGPTISVYFIWAE